MKAPLRSAVRRMIVASLIGAAGIAFIHSPLPERIGVFLMDRSARAALNVIAGGTLLDLGDRQARVYGNAPCPKESGIMAALLGAGENRADCILLDRPTVQVTAHSAVGDWGEVEVWTVHRERNRITLIRPNGLRVSHAP